MKLVALISDLDAEISRLQQARAALAGLSAAKRKDRWPVFLATVPTVAPKKRTMSAAGRARIAEAQRKRWAERKASGTKKQ